MQQFFHHPIKTLFPIPALAHLISSKVNGCCSIASTLHRGVTLSHRRGVTSSPRLGVVSSHRRLDLVLWQRTATVTQNHCNELLQCRKAAPPLRHSVALFSRHFPKNLLLAQRCRPHTLHRFPCLPFQQPHFSTPQVFSSISRIYPQRFLFLEAFPKTTTP